MKDIGKAPDFKKLEQKWQAYWEKNKTYHFDPKSKKPIYSIDTPPPTVSGKMHIGHAFSYTQMDFVARYQRMTGKNLFYPFGTDDNGLATERLIEKEKKVKATKMDREEFIQLCLKTLKELRPPFVQDWKNTGISADFDIFYSTIDDHSRRISQKSFIDLYKQGREYRKEAPVMWCPECETAIAQVELEDIEKKSTFNQLTFKIKEGGELIIATTRPELLSSCVAIFINPEDKRVKKLVGKHAIVPIFGQEVPILKDRRVAMDKGTGIVMCCTFGDQTDAEWYKAYKLPLVVSIGKNGLMTQKAGRYEGMKIEEARKAILDELKKKGYLVEQKHIKHAVNVHERCKTPIEIINSKQWFIKYLDLKKKFIQAGKKINWFPKYMRVRYDNWIKGLQWDWTISRQRFFGVPFPVWYCKGCDEVILAADKDLPVDPLKDKPSVKSCPKCKGKNFVPERDILDTWATSSLTPQLAIELVKDKNLQKKLFPMDLRPQAHDIITFWLFNTVVKSELHEKRIPWKNTTISGHVQDEHGRKMSKSLGNVIAPQGILNEFGADALRYFASITKLGDDSPFQKKELTRGNKLVNKLWNTSRFIFMNLDAMPKKKPTKLETEDKWILSRLSEVYDKYRKSFDIYNTKGARHEVEMFFLHEFCDYYLEIIKSRIYGSNKASRYAAQWTAYNTVYSVLQMFAPILPHITEELYQNLYKKEKKSDSLHLTEFEQLGKKNKDAEALGKLAKILITEIRAWKQKNKIKLGEEVDHLTITHGNPNTNKILDLVGRTMRIAKIDHKKGKFHISK